MKESTKNWLALSGKEFKLAEFSLKANEPIGIIYHLHACLEKTLKAIHEENSGIPPKIHSLKRLALDCCKVELKEKQVKLLDLMDKAFIDSRYPKSIGQFESEYNINSCKELIEETKDIVKCLKSLLKKN